MDTFHAVEMIGETRVFKRFWVELKREHWGEIGKTENIIAEKLGLWINACYKKIADGRRFWKTLYALDLQQIF